MLFLLIYHVGEVKVLESTLNRMGMGSSIFVKCDFDMTEFLATGDQPSSDTAPRTIQDLRWQVENKVLPDCLKWSWSKAHEQVIQEQLKNKQSPDKKAVKEEEGITDANDHTVTCTVRGQNDTANHCLGFDISAATGKVLDLEVISKTCDLCSQKRASLTEEQFEQ